MRFETRQNRGRPLPHLETPQREVDHDIWRLDKTEVDLQKLEIVGKNF